MWQALLRGNLQRALLSVIGMSQQPNRAGLEMSLGDLHCVSSPWLLVFSAAPWARPCSPDSAFGTEKCLRKGAVRCPRPPSSQSHAFHKNLEFPDASVKWGCCNIFLQDKHTNSDLRQIKESPCTDASFQTPAAIVQAFQLSPASSWWLPKALLDMQMRHSSGIFLDEDLGMRCCLAVTMKDFFSFAHAGNLLSVHGRARAQKPRFWGADSIPSWQHSSSPVQQNLHGEQRGAGRQPAGIAASCAQLRLPFILQPHLPSWTKP